MFSATIFMMLLFAVMPLRLVSVARKFLQQGQSTE